MWSLLKFVRYFVFVHHIFAAIWWMCFANIKRFISGWSPSAAFNSMQFICVWLAFTSRHCNVCRSRSYNWRYTSTFINLGVGDDCRWPHWSCELTSLGSALKFGDLCQTQIKPSANVYRFTNPSSLAPPPKSGGANANFTDPTANGDWSYFLLTEFRHGGNLAPGFGVK